jgi:hypothetical protein
MFKAHWRHAVALFFLACVTTAQPGHPQQNSEGGGGGGGNGIPVDLGASPQREPPQLGPTGVGISLDVQPVQPKTIHGEFVYSAKYICGKIPHSATDPQDPPVEFPLVPGTYRTAININNPNLSSVTFTKQALTTAPQAFWPRGKAGTPLTENLNENEGLRLTAKTSKGC